MKIVESLQNKYLQPEYSNYSRDDLRGVEWMWSEPKLQKDLARGRELAGGEGVSDARLKEAIGDCLDEAHTIETAARNPSRWVLPEDNDPNPLVVVLSGPGTYYRPIKSDPYSHLPFVHNGDRERSDQSAILGIQLVGARTGIDLSMFRGQRILTADNPSLNAMRKQTRQAILDSGVRFLYLGTNEEVAATRRVVNTKSSFIPPQVVDLISEGINSTYDQALALGHYLASGEPIRQAQGKQLPGRSIYFALPLKALRFFRFCQQLGSIPDGVETRVLPMPTAKSGFPGYPRNEIAGVLNYAVQGKAALTPAPYQVLGLVR